MPLHPQQVIAWMVIALDIYAYYFMNIVTLSHIAPLAAVLGIVFGVMMVFVVYYGFICTHSDPTDPTVYAERKARRLGYHPLLFN